MSMRLPENEQGVDSESDHSQGDSDHTTRPQAETANAANWRISGASRSRTVATSD